MIHDFAAQAKSDEDVNGLPSRPMAGQVAWEKAAKQAS
jgi:hypothetical protein